MSSCIDRYEASIERRGTEERARSEKGVLPATKTSFQQADKACAASGKRMCELKEWATACQGKEGRNFPYGNEFKPLACNCADNYEDPLKSRAMEAGAKAECRTPEGVYDLSGNLWEWTGEKDPTGTLRLLQGGGFSNKEEYLGCNSEEARHAFQPVDQAYEGNGFRCCKNAQL